MRSFNVLITKGVVVVPSVTDWTGPWLGATRSTSLQRVANRPIVCHVLDTLVQAGVFETAIMAPPEAADEIAACIAGEGPPGIEVHYLVNDRRNESEDPLLAAAEFVGDAPCVLHRANGLPGVPLESFTSTFEETAADALLLVRGDVQEIKRLRLVPQGLPTAVEHGQASAPASGGVVGVCLLGPGALRRLAEPNRNRTARRTLDFAVLAERLAQDGGCVQTRTVQRWRHFTGDALDLLDMNRMVLDELDSELVATADDDNRFEGHIAIHPTASVTSSVIIGPAIVGADALIADSYIGPHTSIAERVHIEGAEIERSIVLADASVLHVGGRLVASIVGREARIFRDFSMPRALRLQVGDRDEVALC
jgi:glucose-1-phosphate thymidylyltransferase